DREGRKSAARAFVVMRRTRLNPSLPRNSAPCCRSLTTPRRRAPAGAAKRKFPKLRRTRLTGWWRGSGYLPGGNSRGKAAVRGDFSVNSEAGIRPVDAFGRVLSVSGAQAQVRFPVGGADDVRATVGKFLGIRAEGA